MYLHVYAARQVYLYYLCTSISVGDNFVARHLPLELCTRTGTGGWSPLDVRLYCTVYSELLAVGRPSALLLALACACAVLIALLVLLSLLWYSTRTRTRLVWPARAVGALR